MNQICGEARTEVLRRGCRDYWKLKNHLKKTEL
jgi:hypothetical protein